MLNIYRTKYFEPCIVISLLMIFILLALTSLTQKSPTFDESVHLTGGYSALVNKDFRVNPENGIFPQLWAAIPLAANREIKFIPKEDSTWRNVNGWLIANKFLFQSGNNFEKMFFMSKFMILIIAALGGLAVYFASKSIWGNPGGYISLFLYTFSPTVLAHSIVVTSDITAAVFFFLSAWFFWRLMQKFTLSRLLMLSFVLSLLALSKMSAIIILPVLLVIAGMRISLRRKLKVTMFKLHYEVQKQSHQVIYILLGLLFSGIFAFAVIWMTHGFRYSMLADDIGREQTERIWEKILDTKNISTEIISFAREHQLIPEAYLLGFGLVLKKSTMRYSFLNGKYSLTGWYSFFPYCFFLKTPVPIILLSIMGLLIPILLVTNSKVYSRRIYLLWSLSFPIALFIVYFMFSVISNLNIGQRHLLPIYLPLFVIAGGTGILIRKYSCYGTLLIALICITLVLENIMIYPHYLAYFTPLSGGPSKGYKHLADSSLDWGQDLKGVKKWLKKEHENDPNVYIAYFGTVNLDAYQMFQKRLLCYFEQNMNDVFLLNGGTYCISATMLQMIYWPDFAEFGKEQEKLLTEYKKQFKELHSVFHSPQKLQNLIDKKGRNSLVKTVREYELLRFAKLCSVLRKRVPDKMIGYSFLIYQLTDEEVNSILDEKEN